MSVDSLTYRADLQGLRAIAIALVVAAHAGLPGLAGGFVGVDVFFVLSGYLITGLLLREHQASGRIDLLAFLARRLRRLLPALLAMLVVTTVLAGVLLSAHEFGVQTGSVGYAASWTSNLYFALTTFDYFNELHRRDLYLHTWSLGVEEQFYLVWSLLCALALRVLARLRSGASPYRGLALLFAILAGGSLALSLYWSANQTLWAFYLMPSRLWQFALGAAVYLVRDAAGRGTRKHPADTWGRIPGKGLVGATLIIGSALLLDDGQGYPGIWALAPSAGAALLILAGGPAPNDPVARGLASALLVWLGDRSYSLYLWHWPLLMLGFAWGLQAHPVSIVALVLLALLVASASYRWVELPLWKGRFSRGAPAPAVAWGLAGIAVVVTALVPLNHLLRDDRQGATAFAHEARDDLPRLYGIPDCDTWFHDAFVRPCVFGPPDARRTAVLLGDSIGAQWFGFLPEIFREPDWRIVVLTKSACPIVDEDIHYAPAGGVYEVCRDWRNQAVAGLQRMRPQVVFVGSSANYGFTPEQWVSGTRRLIARLAASAQRVVMIPGTPQLSFDGPGCLARWLAAQEGSVRFDPTACSEPARSGPPRRVAELLAAAIEGINNADLLDLQDLVCPQGVCSALTARGVVVFRDQQHLTDSFVRANSPAIHGRLMHAGLADLLPEPGA